MELDEVLRGDRESDGVTDRLVKAIIGAIAEEKRKVAVRTLVFVVAFLVMNGGEIVRVDVDAHFDAGVLVAVNIRRACVAIDVAITGANELGALIKRGGQSLKAKRHIEGVSIMGQGSGCLELLFVIVTIGARNSLPERRVKVVGWRSGNR